MKKETKEGQTNTSIRPYSTSDYPEVRTTLENVGLFYEPMDNEALLAEQISSDPGSILVAEVDGQVVGNVLLKATGWGPLLFRLAVRNEFQGRGIGTRLMKAAEQELISRGRPEIHLLVEDGETDLLAFYESLGYEAGHTYRWMWKSLVPKSSE